MMYDDEDNDHNNYDADDENEEQFYINILSKRSGYLYTTCALSSCNYIDFMKF